MNAHFCKVGTIRPNTSKISMKKNFEKVETPSKGIKKIDNSK